MAKLKTCSNMTNLVNSKSILESPSVEAVLSQKEFSSKIQEALYNLNENQRLAIQLRFGLMGEEQYTYKSIGDLMNLSRERATSLYKKAIKNLAEVLNSSEIRAEYFSVYS